MLKIINQSFQLVIDDLLKKRRKKMIKSRQTCFHYFDCEIMNFRFGISKWRVFSDVVEKWCSDSILFCFPPHCVLLSVLLHFLSASVCLSCCISPTKCMSVRSSSITSWPHTPREKPLQAVLNTQS